MDYLLSTLRKEGYAAMDGWMPTDPANKNYAGKFIDYIDSTLDDEICPHIRVFELEDIKKRTYETIEALVNCIHQLACHALIGDECDAAVEFEVQCRLIHAIPDGDIELWKELLKVGCDKGVSHLLKVCHTYYAIESVAATMFADKTIKQPRSPINLRNNY